MTVVINGHPLNRIFRMRPWRKFPFFNIISHYRKIRSNTNIYFFPLALLLLAYRTSRSHSLGTQHSVGLLWTNDQPDAEIYTWQYTAHKRARHPLPGGIRTRNSSNRAAADPRLRLRGHRYQLLICTG